MQPIASDSDFNSCVHAASCMRRRVNTPPPQRPGQRTSLPIGGRGSGWEEIPFGVADGHMPPIVPLRAPRQGRGPASRGFLLTPGLFDRIVAGPEVAQAIDTAFDGVDVADVMQLAAACDLVRQVTFDASVQACLLREIEDCRAVLVGDELDCALAVSCWIDPDLDPGSSPDADMYNAHVRYRDDLANILRPAWASGYTAEAVDRRIRLGGCAKAAACWMLMERADAA